MIQQLSRLERHALAELEDQIRQGLEIYHQVGKALCQIRDQRLYREQYKTFEAYCQERWPFQRHYALRLIDAADVAEDLLTNGQQTPANERQARAMVPLPTAQRQQVWQEATANGPTTASRVQELASKALAGLSPAQQKSVIEGEEKKVIDRTGQERSAADRKGRVGQGLRLLERAYKLFEGVGGSEPDEVLAALSTAIAAAHQLED